MSMVCGHKLARCTSSDSISEDLWIEIFRKLPIETLLRSRCVCKRWRSLISSASFINLQYSITYSTTSSPPPNLKPYLREIDYEYKYDECAFDIYRRRPQETETGVDHIRHYVRFPLESSDDVPDFSVVGSIKGVVCVSSRLDSLFDANILWNPAIHRYVALPRPPRRPQGHVPCFRSAAIGFGYVDGGEIEFKVVRINLPYYTCEKRRRLLSPTCEVYSTREGLWRNVAIADTLIEFLEMGRVTEKRGSLADGTVHWLVSTDNPLSYFVLMFDCEREELSRMDLPRETYAKEEWMISRDTKIVEYGGKLAVVLKYSCGNLQRGSDMWVMWVMEKLGRWKKLYAKDPCLEKMAPYGPSQWDKLGCWYDWVLNDRVYEESMFLLEDHKARSYTSQEILHLYEVFHNYNQGCQ